MLVLIALVAIASAACGDDAPEPPEPAAQAPETNVVRVNAAEYSFGMPEQVTGGTITFELVNTGAQPHEFGFASLEDGKTVEDLKSAFLDRKSTKWAKDLAGVGVLSPDSTVTMVRDLEEGNYSFFCFLPTPEGEPHLSEGMIVGFEVSGTSSSESPEADYVVSATDDGIDVPEIPAGTHLVELSNDGTKAHEMMIISFEPGKKEKDLGKWFNSGYAGDAPALFPGGIQSIKPGTSIVMGIEFVSGRTYTFEDFTNRLTSEITIP